jgi:D-3-phosphoglycerate dehydrogenase
VETGPISRSVLRGLLQPILTESVNLVNAPIIAESRGIRITESKSAAPEDYSNLLVVQVKTDKGKKVIEGTLFGQKDARIVRIDGYQIDVVPEGAMVVTTHIDRPGIIGRVGTLLGNHGINIAGMHVGRAGIGKQAVMVLNVDDGVSDAVMKEIKALDGIQSARLVQFG